jgi:short-subunit dehydrogenase
VALVTGASSGIGREIATLLVERGFSVLGTSPTPQDLGALQRVPGIKYLPLDLANQESIRECATAAGPIDVLVNNAGQSQAGPLEQLPMESIQRLFAVNVFGHIYLTQLCLPGMRERGGGSIVIVGSLMAEFPVPFQSTYAATKLALQGFAQALRMEVAPFGIKVVILQLGSFNTNLRFAREVVVPTNSPYASTLAEVVRRMDLAGERGGHPRRVAEKVGKVLERRRPAPIYSVGGEAAALTFAKRLLGRRRIERLLARRFRLQAPS